MTLAMPESTKLSNESTCGRTMSWYCCMIRSPLLVPLSRTLATIASAELLRAEAARAGCPAASALHAKRTDALKAR